MHRMRESERIFDSGHRQSYRRLESPAHRQAQARTQGNPRPRQRFSQRRIPRPGNDVPGTGQSTCLDQAYRIRQNRHCHPTFRQAATRHRLCDQNIDLVNLAPELQEAIITGNEPDGLSLNRLRRGIPMEWDEQREVFGRIDR